MWDEEELLSVTAYYINAWRIKESTEQFLLETIRYGFFLSLSYFCRCWATFQFTVQPNKNATNHLINEKGDKQNHVIYDGKRKKNHFRMLSHIEVESVN